MFSVRKIHRGLYCLEFDSHIDLVSHFMRFQEIYESPCPKFNGKAFELMDYIRWYTEQSGGLNFTYYDEWVGFNLPVKVVTDFYDRISDKNSYDRFIKAVCDYVTRDSDIPPYLIGTKTGEVGTMRHEIAHGLFYTDRAYENDMQAILNGLPHKNLQGLRGVLRKRGYAESVLDDEIQAFASTELYPGMREWLPKPHTNKFKTCLTAYIKSNRIKL